MIYIWKRVACHIQTDRTLCVGLCKSRIWELSVNCSGFCTWLSLSCLLRRVFSSRNVSIRRFPTLAWVRHVGQLGFSPNQALIQSWWKQCPQIPIRLSCSWSSSYWSQQIQHSVFASRVLNTRPIAEIVLKYFKNLKMVVFNNVSVWSFLII